MTSAVIDAGLLIGTREACVALALSHASWYRDLKPKISVLPGVKLVVPSPRALRPGERSAILLALNSDEFADKSPAQAFHSLLDRGEYLGSIRTFYRVLASVMAVIERRAIARHPYRAAPQLLATAPNQVWSWDITKLKAAGHFLCLYVILDIFSRYVVGWTLASTESSRIAVRLIEETCRRQSIRPGTLTLHSDRGSSMTAGTTYDLLQRLEIEPSHSRPRVSNDNPFSEAQFKTFKYSPAFPDKFGGPDDALAHCRRLFPWYNDEHHHSSLGYLTPAQVHFGVHGPVLDQRAITLARAFELNPNRFVQGVSIPKRPQPVVWINRPKTALPASAPAATPSAASVLEQSDISPLMGDPGSPLFEPLPKLPPSVSHAC
ncbi:MAG: DDE-type integrase/transposase/recombinase [Vicinamibacteria bacterium]